jgi:hypothetical protein
MIWLSLSVVYLLFGLLFILVIARRGEYLDGKDYLHIYVGWPLCAVIVFTQFLEYLNDKTKS